MEKKKLPVNNLFKEIKLLIDSNGNGWGEKKLRHCLRFAETFQDEKIAAALRRQFGLIFCGGKNHEHIELLQLEKSNIKVAEYLTVLPPQKMLEEKLHMAIEIARKKINYIEEHKK